MISTAKVAGTVQFISNHEPALEAGDYTLTSTLGVSAQQVVDGATGTANETSTLRFAVYGERFSLPPSQIQSVFPPANASGPFNNVLPHAVLTRRTLPWERTPRTDGQAAEFSNGNVGSWLALLVLSETQMRRVNTSAGNVEALIPRAAGGLLPEGLVSSLSAGSLDAWESGSDVCNYIDIPSDLFSEVAPSVNDSGWLAHARRKTIPAQTPGAPNDVNDYAVVIANRFPPEGEACVVHLISLERLSDYLPDDDGTPSPKLNAHGVRLILLTNWRITSASDAFRFKELLDRLHGCRPGDDSTFRLDRGEKPGGDADRVAAAALAAGYTALNHETRAGDSTISWYRGPFAPASVALTLPGAVLPASSADAVCAYDPATGMFDVSYACAWTLGRLLGLADLRFAGGMYAFKQSLRQRTSARITGSEFKRSELTSAVKEVLT
jgi:hypothetical protein